MNMDELNVVYYCDSCHVARASYLVKLMEGELVFCGHHYFKNKGPLDEKSYEVIELDKTEEDVPQLEKAEI